MIFVVNNSCKLSVMRMVTWQPVELAPVAKVQVTVMLPLSSAIAVEDWRPVVSACIAYTKLMYKYYDSAQCMFLDLIIPNLINNR